jgi:hypothetical protein
LITGGRSADLADFADTANGLSIVPVAEPAPFGLKFSSCVFICGICGYVHLRNLRMILDLHIACAELQWPRSFSSSLQGQNSTQISRLVHTQDGEL